MSQGYRHLLSAQHYILRIDGDWATKSLCLLFSRAGRPREARSDAADALRVAKSGARVPPRRGAPRRAAERGRWCGKSWRRNSLNYNYYLRGKEINGDFSFLEY